MPHRAPAVPALVHVDQDLQLAPAGSSFGSKPPATVQSVWPMRIEPALSTGETGSS